MFKIAVWGKSTGGPLYQNMSHQRGCTHKLTGKRWGTVRKAGQCKWPQRGTIKRPSMRPPGQGHTACASPIQPPCKSWGGRGGKSGSASSNLLGKVYSAFAFLGKPRHQKSHPVLASTLVGVYYSIGRPEHGGGGLMGLGMCCCLNTIISIIPDMCKHYWRAWVMAMNWSSWTWYWSNSPPYRLFNVGMVAVALANSSAPRPMAIPFRPVSLAM